MRAANSNCERSRWTITIDDWGGNPDFDDVFLVTIYKGAPKGEPEHAEIVEGMSAASAYSRSMARHLRCPIHNLTEAAL